MSDLYYEQLVAKKKAPGGKAIRIGMIALAVFMACAGLVVTPIALLPAILLGVGAYFYQNMTDVEYEYLFVNGDLDIDKIVSKSKRKKAKSVKMEDVIIAAPMNSHRLDYYNGSKDLHVEDFSSGMPDAKRFVLITKSEKETCKVIIEPDEALAKTIKNCAPSKVFLD